LKDVIGGLHYLHSKQVVHGDLKGVSLRSNLTQQTMMMMMMMYIQDNILVDDFGSARLCDFGLASLPQGTKASTRVGVGSTRYMAPELFDIGTECDESPKPTAASDVYALSSVTLEVLALLLWKAEVS
jgi:serine/threonine protein kinase